MRASYSLRFIKPMVGLVWLWTACFRNYVSAGMYDEAAEMINSGTLVSNNSQFQRLYQLCIPTAETMRDPTATFRKDFQRKKCANLIEAIKSCAISVGK
jgi:hypothetical protein